MQRVVLQLGTRLTQRLAARDAAKDFQLGVLDLAGDSQQLLRPTGRHYDYVRIVASSAALLCASVINEAFELSMRCRGSPPFRFTSLNERLMSCAIDTWLRFNG